MAVRRRAVTVGKPVLGRWRCYKLITKCHEKTSKIQPFSDVILCAKLNEYNAYNPICMYSVSQVFTNTASHLWPTFLFQLSFSPLRSEMKSWQTVTVLSKCRCGVLNCKGRLTVYIINVRPAEYCECKPRAYKPYLNNVCSRMTELLASAQEVTLSIPPANHILDLTVIFSIEFKKKRICFIKQVYLSVDWRNAAWIFKMLQILMISSDMIVAFKKMPLLLINNKIRKHVQN